MHYSAVLDISDASLGLGTFALSDGVHTNISITLANLRANDGRSPAQSSALFFHHSWTVIWNIISQDGRSEVRLPKVSRSPLAVALAIEIRAQATANGWASPAQLNVTMNETTGLYTIGYNPTFGSNVNLQWTTAAGRALLGFTADVGGAIRHTGTLVPTYLIVPTLRAVSNPTPDRDSGPVGSFAISDDGSVGYGVAKPGAGVEREFTQAFEPVEKVEPAAALAAHPWTHRHLFAHCSKGFAFLVHSGGFGNLYPEFFHLRAEGTAFEAKYASPMNTARRSIEYRVFVMGAMVPSI